MSRVEHGVDSLPRPGAAAWWHPRAGWKVRVVRTLALLAAPVVAFAIWIESMPSRTLDRPLADLTRAAEVDRADRLRASVVALATTGGRRGSGLVLAADWIEASWADLDLQVTRLPYELSGGDEVVNLQVVLPGRDRELPCLVVGAHYDTFGNTPGADDNASGVALLLELSRDLRESSLARDVRLVAFACEEPPYFDTAEMGSARYVAALENAGVPVLAMVSLESLGCFRDAAGTQSYPAGLSWLFPGRGHFVAVVGDVGSRRLASRTARLLIDHGTLPVESAALPSFLPGVDWSDHRSFRARGIPAVMLTDTAPFRNPHYHRRTDTPETLDYRAMALLADALPRIVEELAE